MHFMRALVAVILCSALCGCGSLISEYSIEAYKNATTLKAETLALVDKSTSDYSRNAKDVDELTTKINAAYEFSAGLPSNELSARQWDILRDPNGNLYGGFVKRWKTSGRVSPAYRDEKRDQLGQAFNYIICLEANKKEAKSCTQAVAAGQ
jgi:hypothetical protein